MIYLVSKEEGIFNKGDRLKAFIRKYNPDLDNFQEELIDDFVLENFFYDKELDCYVIISDLDIDSSQLKEKLQDAELFIRKEE
jgi:hypothetical protein